MFGLWTGGQGQRLDTSDALSALRAQKPQPHGLAPVGGGPAGERGVQLEACGVRGGWKPTRRSVMGAVTTVPPHLQVLGGGGGVHNKPGNRYLCEERGSRSAVGLGDRCGALSGAVLSRWEPFPSSRCK